MYRINEYCPVCGNDGFLHLKGDGYSSNLLRADPYGSVNLLACDICGCVYVSKNNLWSIDDQRRVKAAEQKASEPNEFGATTHDLKILPEYYLAVDNRIKTFEIRRNDRDYKVGDTLRLREYRDGQYTGRMLYRTISYIIDDPAYCKDGFVVLGIY